MILQRRQADMSEWINATCNVDTHTNTIQEGLREHNVQWLHRHSQAIVCGAIEGILVKDARKEEVLLAAVGTAGQWRFICLQRRCGERTPRAFG